jgi:hypothetical protein
MTPLPGEPVVIDGGDLPCVRLLLVLPDRVSRLLAGTLIHLTAFVPDEALARPAAQLAPAVAIETITAWLDSGQPEPARAAGRVRQAIMSAIGAVTAPDADCTLPSPAHPEGPPS